MNVGLNRNLNEDLLNVAAEEGPVVDVIVLEIGGWIGRGCRWYDGRGGHRVSTDKAWAPPWLSGSYTKDDVTG
jgi:hypothetical protein